MKKFLIPPIVPVLMVLALSFWTVWDETSNGTPRMIDGQPDDAPMFAAIFLIVLSPIFYLMFAVLNLIDSRSDQFRKPFPWLASGVMTVILAVLMLQIFCVPKVDASPATGITMACVTAVLVVWPMCLLRRLKYSCSPASP
ncbi:MAG: hypothetical protein WCS43_18615 [Verrucomicrobiota bacterium]